MKKRTGSSGTVNCTGIPATECSGFSGIINNAIKNIKSNNSNTEYFSGIREPTTTTVPKNPAKYTGGANNYGEYKNFASRNPGNPRSGTQNISSYESNIEYILLS
ncbi:Hypothetical predicted protein, partial [Paramuricea clavata]